ncbi:MFS transporter [Sphingosinicella sp. BN140058]|uniref:MFS transporter n=1 Tax=Sphingosinicella sp. BN140058 TaxID=1892855 RepID=UPI0010138CE8|nr:MFS transporter [Sphingosinicella sp. BN140058]QAY76438.1 MFS transporter [Sphingosinicella sp. BN140058]
MDRDPRTTLADAPMSPAQIVAVLITVALNALDGFDVLAISFASPGIASEWGIDRAALGVVLSMELIGMAVGSIILGGVTDRIGRRPMILACLCVMAAGMFMVTTTTSIFALSAWRVFTGLGIGGMLAATNATVAEYANARSRNFCVALMAIGYPIGAVLGGMVAAQLLKGHDWRFVFYFGGGVTLAFLPIVWWLLPETIPFLCQKQGPGALAKVNRALARMGHAAVAVLPPAAAAGEGRSLGDVFRPALLATTLLVTLAYFTHIATFYFILKWVPKIVVDMGFAPSAAAGVLVWANVGGAIGGALLGLLARSLPLRPLILVALTGSVVMVSWFGRGQSDLAHLSLVVGISGFFTNAGVVGLYAVFAQAFPTHVRATGTGFAIGVGRGGAAISPIVAGLLFEAGFGLQGVAIVMAAGAAVAAVAILLLPRSAAGAAAA